MKEITDFAININDSKQSELSFGKQKLPFSLDGQQIVSQFDLGDYYLVVTDENDPWENFTYLNLLSKSFEKLDKKKLGSYGTGFASRTFDLDHIAWQGDQSFELVPSDKAQQSEFFDIKKRNFPFSGVKLSKRKMLPNWNLNPNLQDK